MTTEVRSHTVCASKEKGIGKLEIEKSREISFILCERLVGKFNDSHLAYRLKDVATSFDNILTEHWICVSRKIVFRLF